MYTEAELRAAADVIGQVAREQHLSETQARACIERAMNAAMHNPNPAAQALWKTFPCADKPPTLEVFLLWAVALLNDISE